MGCVIGLSCGGLGLNGFMSEMGGWRDVWMRGRRADGKKGQQKSIMVL